MTAETGTGIAGAMDYRPAQASSGPTCFVCDAPFEAPYAARVTPGRFAQVCSPACADDPKFRDVWVKT